MRFGVYHTKSGGVVPLRSPMSDDDGWTLIGTFRKYSQGLSRTA